MVRFYVFAPQSFWLSAMARTLHPVAHWLFTWVLYLYRLFARLALRVRSIGSGATAAERRVTSGEAWDDFCDTLKAAGASMLAPGAPRDAFSQAEGYRYLSRLTRAGLENFLECADVEAPRLCAIANGSRDARICIGSDNPDNLYENATIDGRLEYVVEGERGSVQYLGFGTQSGRYGGKGGLRTVDYVEASQLKMSDGGRFEIRLSAAEPPRSFEGNWLRLEPEPREAMFIVRQTFGDRSRETAAAVSIRRLGAGDGAPPPSALTAERLDEALQSASVLVAGASAMFASWAYGFQRHTNALPLFDQARSDRAGGDPNIRYYHSYWRLAADECLAITISPPRCRCWNFQLNNHWMESLDYRHHAVHTNSTLARPDDADGGAYTLIVAHDDPNRGGAFVGNWIDTVGHSCGTMCFRWVAPEVDGDQLPSPRVAVEKLEAVRRAR